MKTPEPAPPVARGAAVLASLVLAGSVAGTLALSAVVLLPAHGAENVHLRKSRPTPTSSSSTSPSPTSSPTSSPSATATTSPSSTATAEPTSGCGDDPAVAFQGRLYCPGVIAGVVAGAYGTNSRIVLSVTVTDVSGDLVHVMGGPGCWVDPSWTEPVYCGDTLGTMTVDFTGADQLPAPSTGIELYGVTQPGSLVPDGFLTTSWCDPDHCP